MVKAKDILGQISKARLEKEKKRVLARGEKLADGNAKLVRHQDKLLKKGINERDLAKKRKIAMELIELEKQIMVNGARVGMLAKKVKVLNKLIRYKKNEKELRSDERWDAINENLPEDLDELLFDEGSMEMLDALTKVGHF